MLRNARLDQGSTLQDISARTRILSKNLEAIESDDLRQISSPFLYRSFVRQFAQEVKLVYGLLAEAVQAASSEMPQPRLPGEAGEPLVRVARIQPKIRHDFHWIYSAVALVAVVVLCSGLYAVLRPGGGRILLPSPVSTLTSLATHFGREASKSPSNPTARPAPDPTLAAGEPPAAEIDNGIHIRLMAIEATWLSIVADGEQTYSGILKASQTKVLVGRETARIRAGNAGGVTIVFNGRELGPMGRRGETRTVLFTTTGYEVVRSAAQALVPALFTPVPEKSFSQIAE
ncbi:MAG TPA: helix-turn-helix domain-containing protein [Bryobacteraceae bacterium]|nr:helix-turn-helix domain-containing protein [Bryobacteraceae bacterium]